MKFKPFFSKGEGPLEESKGLYIYTSKGKEIIININDKDELIITCEDLIVKPTSENQIKVK